MNPTTLFYLLITIIIVKFLFDTFLNALNAKHYNDSVPKELNDVYNEEEYLKSQKYKGVNYKFSLITSSFSLLLTLLFFAFDGFAFVDKIANELSNNPILITLLFFGIIFFASDFISIPLAYYKTFVIEEKFGFNKTTKTTFFLDKIKGWVMLIIIGGGILALISWFYMITTSTFWLYTWLLISIFSIFTNMFYSKIIVPMLNKQTPLESGE